MFKLSLKSNIKDMADVFRNEVNDYKEYNKQDIYVGVPDDAVKVDEKGKSTLVKDYARWNEYGVVSQNIPARPFMRNSLKPFFTSKILEAFEDKGEIKGRHSVLNALTNMAKQGVENAQDSIDKGGWLQNAPTTAAKKGFNRPLYDTGTMIESISYNIVKRER